ncbi:ABC transporter ATP-binding protein [Aerococcus sp. UMB7834]|uniref:ABC transporter ATP-binding protein n=1 Tax=Aerococcus sp. UMB7834 TaxID=3046342 RepID=UPI00254A05FE|nr:ABC transporter ATP-binding protein [Aerococcus sp. UMB7834]MDK6804753.1 ABC transporter ATP-binding protein [Aerococcus sp. UMB7834]
MANEALEIQELTVVSQPRFKPDQELIHRVSTTFSQGRITGLVGESGSGKTMLMKAVMQLLPQQVSVSGGEIRWQGQALGQGDPLPFSMIFQDPLSSLNPLRTVAYHLNEVIERFYNLDQASRQDLMLDYLDKVGIANGRQVLGLYPHELSGGMIQRIMICLALLKKPQILIADEPTTALDVTIQAQILDILKRLNQEEGLTIIFVSHDLAVIRELCHEVKVMYDGKIVEEAPVAHLFDHPAHPYTQELIRSVPAGRHKERLHEMQPVHLSEADKAQSQLRIISDEHRVLGGVDTWTNA